MSSPSSEGGEYQVSNSGAIAQVFLQLQRQAMREGRARKCFRQFERFMNICAEIPTNSVNRFIACRISACEFATPLSVLSTWTLPSVKTGP